MSEDSGEIGRVKFRWVELTVAVAASVVTSALTMTSVLSSMRSEVTDHGRRVNELEQAVNHQSISISALTAREDAQERGRLELQDRLKSMDEKLDRIWEGVYGRLRQGGR